MEITIAPPKPEKVETKSFIVKALIHKPGRHGTFYIGGGQLNSLRSKATRFTRDEAYSLIQQYGYRHGLNLEGVLLTAVPVVKTRGESGGRD